MHARALVVSTGGPGVGGDTEWPPVLCHSLSCPAQTLLNLLHIHNRRQSCNDGDKAAFFPGLVRPHLNFTFTSELTGESSVNVKFKGCKLYKIDISRNRQNIDIST